MTKRPTYRDMLDPDRQKKKQSTSNTQNSTVQTARSSANKLTATKRADTSRRDENGIWRGSQAMVTGEQFGNGNKLNAEKKGTVKSSYTDDRRAKIGRETKGQSYVIGKGFQKRNETPQNSYIDKVNPTVGQEKKKGTSIGGINYDRAEEARKKAGNQSTASLLDKGYKTYQELQKQRKSDMSGLTDEEYDKTVNNYLSYRPVNSVDDVFATAGDTAGFLKQTIKNLDKEINDLSATVTTSKDPTATNKRVNELRSYKDRLTATMNQFKNESLYSEGVQKREWYYENSPDTAQMVQRGMQGETFLSGVTDDEFANSYARSLTIGLSEDDTLKAASRFMTDREKGVYYATRAREGDEAAKDYLRNLYQYGDLGNRVTEATDKMYDSNEDLNPIVRGIVKYGGSFTSGIGNSIEGMGDAMMRIADEDYIHAENIGKKMYAFRKQQNPDDIGVDIAFNTGNMMPAIVTSIATGGASSPSVAAAVASSTMVGVSSFGNTYQDAKRQGYTTDEATSYALATGISEAALQYALNGVAAMAGGSVTASAGARAVGAVENAAVKVCENGAKNVIQRLLANEPARAMMNKLIMLGIGSSGEFEEEYLQAVLEPVFRSAFLGELTQVEPFSEDTVYQGILGALSAGVMNSGQTALQVRAENQAGAKMLEATKNADGTTGPSLVEKILTTGGDNDENLLDSLPDTADAKRRALAIKAQGLENTSNGEVGRFAMSYAKEQDADAGIKALVRGLLSWNQVSDDGRKRLVDPKYAEYLRERYGLDVDENTSPEDMKRAVQEKWNENRRYLKRVVPEIESYLRGEIGRGELSQEARDFINDPTYMGWALENYSNTFLASTEQRSQAIDEFVERFAGRELTEDEQERLAEIKERALSEITYGKELKDINAIREIEDFIYSLRGDNDDFNSSPFIASGGETLTNADRENVLDILQGRGLNRETTEQSIEAPTAEETPTESAEEIATETPTETAPTETTESAPYGEALAPDITGEVEMTPEAFSEPQGIDTSDPQAVEDRAAELMEKEDRTAAESNQLKFIRSEYPEQYDDAYTRVFGEDSLNEQRKQRQKSVNTEVKAQPSQENQYESDRAALRAQQLTDYKQKSLTKEQQKQRTHEKTEAVAYELLDTLASFDAAGKKAKSGKIYNSINSARNAARAAAFSIGMSTAGQSTFQANYKGEAVGRSLREVFSPLYKSKHPEALADFFDYLRAWDQIDRVKQGRGHVLNAKGEVMTEAEAQAIIDELEDKYAVKRKNGEKGLTFTRRNVDEKFRAKKSLGTEEVGFKELAQDVWNYSRNLLDYRLDAGLISKEAHDIIADQHKHYIPAEYAVDSPSYVERSMESGGVTKTINRDTGSTSGLPFNPIDDVLARQTVNVIVNAKRNYALQVLADEYQRNPKGVDGYVRYVEEAEDAINRVESKHTNTSLDGINAQVDEFFKDEIMQAKEADRIAGTLELFKDGKKYTMRVSDGILKGFNSLNTDISKVEKVIGAGNNMFRMLITNYNPSFLLRNFFKDMGDSLFFSINTRKFVRNYGQAWKQMTSNGDIWQLYQANGGFASSFFQNPAQGGKGVKGKRNLVARFTVDKIETANMTIEQAPRFAEFMTSLEEQGVLTRSKDVNGHTVVEIDYDNLTQDMLDEAMYRANDITVNFARGGHLTKMASRTIVPFLNAGVQDCTRIVRHFQQKGGRAWFNLIAKAAAFGIAPAAVSAMLYEDDDEYQEGLSDYYKDNFYVFKYGDGQWLTIPKGRFMTVFGGATRRLVETAQGKEVDWKSYADTVTNNIAPANPITDNIFYPAFRNFVLNENWYGGKIDSEYELKHPENAYDESTSVIFKWIGQGLGVSPKRLQDLADSYGGVVADIAIPLTNNEAKYDEWWQAALGTVTNSFTKNTQYDTSGVSSQYYALRDELDTRRDDERENWADEVKTPTDYVSYYFNDTDKEISKLYENLRMIYDANIQNKDKRTLVNFEKQQLSTLYATASANSELLEKTIRKYWNVDPTADVEIQKRQSSEAYMKALYDVFGSEIALRKSGVSEKKLGEIKRQGINLNDYYKYYSLTRSGDKYMTLDADGSTQNYTDAEKKQFLLDAKVSEDSMKKIYAREFEDKDTKEMSTIKYASSHGVRTEAFIKRAIQASGEEGDKLEKTTYDTYWEDGELKTRATEGETYAQGTKLVKSIDNLLNSGYTDKEIEYFYQKEHSTDNGYVYALASGMSAKDYLDYKYRTATLRADKDEDGNTISGSLKKKIWAQLSQMDISEPEKLLLFANNYKLKKNEYTAVAKYITGLDISRDQMVSVLEGLGFTVQDGKVYAP